MLQPLIIRSRHRLLHAFPIFGAGLGLPQTMPLDPGVLRAVTHLRAKQEVHDWTEGRKAPASQPKNGTQGYFQQRTGGARWEKGRKPKNRSR